MIDTKRIGERIAALRKKQGLTGEKFAELLNVSPQAVSKWENGKNLPETILLPDISKLLGVSIDSVLMPQAYEDEHRIHPKNKTAFYTGAGYPHSNAYAALFTAVGLFFGCESRLNEKNEQINDDEVYHVQTALTGEAFGVQYSELFESNCLQRCLGIFGISPKVIDCVDSPEQQVRDLVCTSISKDTPVIIEPKDYSDIIFAFGYKESGKVLCCCPFLDGADDKNCSYDFSKYRLLRNRTAHVKRLILLEGAEHKLDIAAVYAQSLKFGLRMMTSPSDTMDFTKLRGAGSSLYDAWITLLKEANEVNSGFFYMDFPVFPQLIILYENRLHLSAFLGACAKVNNDNSLLLQAQKKCDELTALAMEGVLIGTKCEQSKPEILAMNNNERRTLLIDILRRCNGIEHEMIMLLKDICEV